MVRYLNDFQKILGINVQFRSNASKILRQMETGRFKVYINDSDIAYTCKYTRSSNMLVQSR